MTTKEEKAIELRKTVNIEDISNKTVGGRPQIVEIHRKQ